MMLENSDFDAIVIGSGHNGLVSALYLARAGWRVLVLEQSHWVGGALYSAEVTLPGFKHDLFASNFSLFLRSPVYREFQADFDALGLNFLRNEAPFASAYPNGRSVGVYVDHGRTERQIAQYSDRDVTAWRRFSDFFARSAPKFLPIYFMAMPSVASFRQLVQFAGGSLGDAYRMAVLSCQSTRQFVDRHFESPEVKGLFTPWGFHSDISTTTSGGAAFGLIIAMSSAHRGLALAEGGAGRIADALRSLIERQGVPIQTGREVVRIKVRHGNAVGVVTSDGQELTARRAIIANTSPGALFGHLVKADELPSGFVRKIRRYRYGPGTFVLHLALDRPLEWRGETDLAEFNHVHLNGDGECVDAAYSQALEGRIPARPMLIVNQTTQTDPSRAPSGKHILRINARAFPRDVQGDAAGVIRGRKWEDIREAVADRLIDQLSDYVSNLKQAILSRHSVSPLDLERLNPNMVGGDCSSGSHHLDHSYFMRPVRGWSKYRTPIERLYMVGAPTWPASGVHGGSGYLLARSLLSP